MRVDVVLVGSPTICNKWKADIMDTKEEDIQVNVKVTYTCNNTAVLSFTGGRDVRKCCNSSTKWLDDGGQ